RREVSITFFMSVLIIATTPTRLPPRPCSRRDAPARPADPRFHVALPPRAARTPDDRLRRAVARHRRSAPAGRDPSCDFAAARAREGARRRRAPPGRARYRLRPDGDDR